MSMISERNRMLTVTSTVLFFSILVWFNYSAILPLIIDEWDLSGTGAGIIFSAFQVGYLIAILPAGKLADEFSPRWVIASGAAGAGIWSLMFGLLAGGFISGTILRFLSGMFMAGVYVPGMRFISDWFPTDIRGRALGFYVGTFSFGSGFSFVAGSKIATAFDWETAILLTSIGAVVSAPAMILFASDTEQSFTRGGSQFELSVLFDRKYISAVFTYMFHSWEVFGVRNWILVFLVATPAFASGESPISAGTIAGIVLMLGGAGNVFGGLLSDVLGRAQTIGLALGTSTLITIILPLVFEASPIIIIGLVFIYGVTLTADSSPISTVITEVAPDEHVGMALSVQSLIGYIGASAAPIMFGLALDLQGFIWAFWMLALGAIGGLVSLVIFYRSN